MLTREFLINRPLTFEPVPAPEIAEGETIGVKLLTAGEFLAVSANQKTKSDEAYVPLLTAAVVDATGANVFTADDAEHIKALPFTLVQRLVEVAQRLNGLAGAAAGN